MYFFKGHDALFTALNLLPNLHHVWLHVFDYSACYATWNRLSGTWRDPYEGYPDQSLTLLRQNQCILGAAWLSFKYCVAVARWNSVALRLDESGQTHVMGRTREGRSWVESPSLIAQARDGIMFEWAECLRSAARTTVSFADPSSPSRLTGAEAGLM